jgi:hypothetical protein
MPGVNPGYDLFGLVVERLKRQAQSKVKRSLAREEGELRLLEPGHW